MNTNSTQERTDVITAGQVKKLLAAAIQGAAAVVTEHLRDEKAAVGRDPQTDQRREAVGRELPAVLGRMREHASALESTPNRWISTEAVTSAEAADALRHAARIIELLADLAGITIEAEGDTATRGEPVATEEHVWFTDDTGAKADGRKVRVTAVDGEIWLDVLPDAPVFIGATTSQPEPGVWVRRENRFWRRVSDAKI